MIFIDWGQNWNTQKLKKVNKVEKSITMWEEVEE